MAKPKNNFYNKEAKSAFDHIYKELEEETKYIDEDLIVSYCNLRSQEIELNELVKEEGYRVTNVNSRGEKRTKSIRRIERTYHVWQKK